MPPLSEDYIRDDTKPGELFITGLEVSLSKLMVDPNRDLYIQADTVEISEDISLPGKLVQIFARQVHVKNPADPAAPLTINVSGADGENKHGRAKDGAQKGPGAPGDQGAPGEPGLNAGNIEIYAESMQGSLKLQANGGIGGTPEDGGNGAKGVTGEHGGNTFQDHNGKQGLKGGQAGLAGVPGKGGDAGSIKTIIFNATKDFAVTAETLHGKKGEPGKNGSPGDGGDGGAAGSYTTTTPGGGGARGQGGREPTETVHPGHQGPPGPRGDEAGNPPGQPPPVNVDGKDGVYTHQTGPDDALLPAFREKISLPLAHLMLRQSVLDHLNENFDEAAERVRWLYKIIDGHPDEKFGALRTQAGVEIGRLVSGYDAFGNPPSFVPMVTYQAYSDYIKRWLEAAETAEQLHESYTKEERDQKIALNALRDQLHNLDTLKGNLEENVTQFEKHQDDLQDDINRLFTAVLSTGAKLASASEKFQRAAERGGDCGFADLIKGAGAIVGMASGIAGTIGAVSDVIDDLKKDSTHLIPYLKTIAKSTKAAQKEFNGLAEAYNDYKKVLDNPATPGVPTDEAKIIADLKDVKKTVTEYKKKVADLPEADEFLQVIDDYINLTQARNAKILEYDAVVLQVAQSQAAIVQAGKDKNSLQGKAATETDPYLTEFQDFMTRALDMYKSELIRSLYNAHRALSYITLTNDKLQYGRQTVSELTVTASLLDQTLMHAKEEQGRELASLTLDSNQAPKFSLKKLIGNNNFELLKNRKLITFSLPDDAFKDFCHVYTTKLRTVFALAIEGAKPVLRLTHCGHAKFKDEKGADQQFTHAMRTNYIYSNATGNELGQGNDFISLTPYGPWQVSLDLAQNDQISFETLKDIDLEFEIQYMPKPAILPPTV